MPLALPALQSGLLDLFTSPGDAPACARAWADAMVSYASGVVPPSTTISTAGDALADSLAGAFASPATPAAPLMETAFLAFATTLAAGMLPAYAAIPPPAPVNFAAQFAGPKPETHDDAAQQIAGIIDAWMKAGTATLVAPPNTPLTWT